MLSFAIFLAAFEADPSLRRPVPRPAVTSSRSKGEVVAGVAQAANQNRKSSNSDPGAVSGTTADWLVRPRIRSCSIRSFAIV